MKAVNREEDRVGILSRLVYSPETGAITWLSRPVEDRITWVIPIRPILMETALNVATVVENRKRKKS